MIPLTSILLVSLVITFKVNYVWMFKSWMYLTTFRGSEKTHIYLNVWQKLCNYLHLHNSIISNDWLRCLKFWSPSWGLQGQINNMKVSNNFQIVCWFRKVNELSCYSSLIPWIYILMIYNWSQLKSIEIRHFFYYYYCTQSLPINELSIESKDFMIVLRIAYVLAWMKQCKFSATANDYYVNGI